MSEKRACHHETLAANAVAEVQRCRDCGCLSLHLGAFTVRTDGATLEALWALMGDALAELRVRQLAEQPTVLHRGAA
jgi:hypothetical protein